MKKLLWFVITISLLTFTISSCEINTPAQSLSSVSSASSITSDTVSEASSIESASSEAVSEQNSAVSEVSEASKSSETSEVILYPLTTPLNLDYSKEEFAKFIGTYAQKTSKVTDDYFSNVIMLGDSLTYGLELTNNYPAEKTLAAEGKGVYNILDTETELKPGDGYKKTIDWLSILKPEVLYINLGTNGIEELDNDIHINCYNDMLDKIVAVCPNTKIVLISIPPFSEERGGTASGTSLNNKLVYFNMLLLETAKERGLYFVNGAEALVDDKCTLTDEFDAGDGQHWTLVAREAYMDYLYTHPILD